MKLHFFGAASEVTGSKHILDNNGYKILLDCGLHQGRRKQAYELNKSLPFDAKSLNSVILSHAHADHCGTLPLLYKSGYTGVINATDATAQIAHLIMLDSANVQRSDYEHLLGQGFVAEDLLTPLYTSEEVEETSTHFQIANYQRIHQDWNVLDQHNRFKFYDAGHILGSAVTVIECQNNQETKRILFTGDLGNGGVPILHDPEDIKETIDTLIIECTYGDRLHRPISEVDDFLVKIITQAVEQKQKIIVPAFALGRTQELIYILHRLHNEGRIPVLPIYIDSPLSNRITQVFSKHLKDFDQQAWTDFMNNHESPFAFENLHYVSTKEESKALNTAEGPFMVIASSGMAEGGRILHHLEHTVWDPQAVIILTGYQAAQTLGRKIQEGHAHVPIFGRMHELKAQVCMINEFSAHADQNGLYTYIEKLKGLKKVFLVHGEPPAAEALRALLQEKLPHLSIHIPQPGEEFEV
ncbi:MBL fold metallo-hydrolase [Candidatus Falkowbacteria bacterium]|nr:MAG: MBL fold metallo-hydrolase [Candidatus Falkowbacteria bacterium]